MWSGALRPRRWSPAAAIRAARAKEAARCAPARASESREDPIHLEGHDQVLVEFTPREVAELSGTPKWTVEKAIEQNVLAPVHGKRGRRKRRRLLPLYAVAYVKVVDGVDLRMDVRMKRRLASQLARLDAHEFSRTRIELAPAVELDVGRLVGDAVQKAEAYGAVRDAMIVEDDTVPGGDPVLRDTHASVYALAERIADGETLADIQADYPSTPKAAIEAALIYARAHPPVGAPPREDRRGGHAAMHVR
jgi:uncharacterized protein (DUF433 family)